MNQAAGATRQAISVPVPAPGSRYRYVDAAATTAGDGSKAHPYRALQSGVSSALPGDVVLAAKGTYIGPVSTVRAGELGRPIVLLGQPGATLRGVAVDQDRLVTLVHSWTVLQGFTLTNADKGVWLQGASHVVVRFNTITGLGGECVRVKYLATSNEVAGNTIGPCGLQNFNLKDDNKNGEGIYIGTAPEQLNRNPTDVPDASDGNWIHDNVIRPRAECVDVKEGAERNVIERNTCSGGLDPDGSGLDLRGNHNVLRFNAVSDYVGKGVRLGGDSSDQGIDNDVYGNLLQDTGSYAVGVMRTPQGRICGNTIHANKPGAVNVDSVWPTAAC